MVTGSSFDIHYGVPNDGRQYSGQVMTQVVNGDGSVSVQTWPIRHYGGPDQSGYATGWNYVTIPLGGAASISITETARVRVHAGVRAVDARGVRRQSGARSTIIGIRDSTLTRILPIPRA